MIPILKFNPIKLGELLPSLKLSDKTASMPVSAVFLDSRIKAPRGVFFCIKGLTHDSHDYVEEAIKNGAIVIIHQKPLDSKILEYKDILFVKVPDSRLELAYACSRATENPSNKLKLFGVTGTNGKTTTAYIIYRIMSKLGKAGYNGTIGTFLGANSLPYSHLTTPDSIELMQTLKTATEENVEAMALEISSHGLEAKRAHGLELDAAIFTNLSRDHLDYHGNMENYLAAKLQIFDLLKPNGKAIINADDTSLVNVKNRLDSVNVISFGKTPSSDYRLDQIAHTPSGSSFTLHLENASYKISTDLISQINIYNLTAAIAAVHSSGVHMEDIIPACRNLDLRIGRFQQIPCGDRFVIVDYAHTPDGFKQIFEFASNIKADRDLAAGGDAAQTGFSVKKTCKIIAVFGSAGKRDKGKRPEMGAIASKYSDLIILTEEDHRDESPAEIAREIAVGISADFKIQTDREKAIELAFKVSGAGDIILILGKGNEDFLDRWDKTDPWEGDDVVAAKFCKIL